MASTLDITTLRLSDCLQSVPGQAFHSKITSLMDKPGIAWFLLLLWEQNLFIRFELLLWEHKVLFAALGAEPFHMFSMLDQHV